MEKLATILKNKAGLSPEEITKVAALLNHKTYKKNEIIFPAGKPCPYLYFIVRQICRFQKPYIILRTSINWLVNF